ncbi:hypothetical protein PUN28_014091 [Cardiocondyla obscurior]|uniref:Uncharacterized protein n=1 Tax=Cardiocondyla obscurior TaxID=286306 RepID=A0AAW2F0R9_9HYME
MQCQNGKETICIIKTLRNNIDNISGQLSNLIQKFIIRIAEKRSISLLISLNNSGGFRKIETFNDNNKNTIIRYYRRDDHPGDSKVG